MIKRSQVFNFRNHKNNVLKVRWCIITRVTYARGEGVDRGTISIKERGGEEPGLKRAVRKMGEG